MPNCIARPGNAPHRGFDPPVPGSRARKRAEDAIERNDVKRPRDKGGEESQTQDDVMGKSWVDPVGLLRGMQKCTNVLQVDIAIGNLRDYLRNSLRQNKLTTDWKEGARVVAANQKSKPEPIPEHNDPYRIDWTEFAGRAYLVGTDVRRISRKVLRLTQVQALRLPESSQFRIRYPILHRSLNRRDWQSSQVLLDDIAVILEEALRTELRIAPRDYSVRLNNDCTDDLTFQEIFRYPHCPRSR